MYSTHIATHQNVQYTHCHSSEYTVHTMPLIIMYSTHLATHHNVQYTHCMCSRCRSTAHACPWFSRVPVNQNGQDQWALVVQASPFTVVVSSVFTLLSLGKPISWVGRQICKYVTFESSFWGGEWLGEHFPSAWSLTASCLWHESWHHQSAWQKREWTQKKE